MVVGRILYDPRHTVLQIRDPNQCGGRLGIDELLDVLQLRTETRARAVVDQNKEFEGAVVPRRWRPFGDLIAVLAFVHHHIIPVDHGDVGTMLRLDRDYQARLSAGGRWLLRPRHCNETNSKDQPSEKKEMTIHRSLLA